MDLQASMEMDPSDPSSTLSEEEMGGSLDYDTDDSTTYAAHLMSRWPQPPPKSVKPHFTKIPDLPIEIRQMIWRYTLQPRTIEVEFSPNCGFYACVKTPVALKACSESRQTVRIVLIVSKHCETFNCNVDDPRSPDSTRSASQPALQAKYWTLKSDLASSKVVNFALDTIYFHWAVQSRITQFLTGMMEHEAAHIQSITVHYIIDEEMDHPYVPEDYCLSLFKVATGRMPAMKQFMIVYTLDELWHEHGFPKGMESMELFHEFAHEWHQYVLQHGCCSEDWDDGGCECVELPSSSKNSTFQRLALYGAGDELIQF